jgi:hypothetical protein
MRLPSKGVAYGMCDETTATRTIQNSTLRPTSPMRPQLSGPRSSRVVASTAATLSYRADECVSRYFVFQANVKNAHAATATTVPITQITRSPSPERP